MTQGSYATTQNQHQMCEKDWAKKWDAQPKDKTASNPCLVCGLGQSPKAEVCYRKNCDGKTYYKVKRNGKDS